jgi:Fungal specific transcription factor domain
MLDGPELPTIDPIDPYGVQTHSIKRTSGYQQTSPSSVPDHRTSRTGSQQHYSYQATSVGLPEHVLQEQGSNQYTPSAMALTSPGSQGHYQVQTQVHVPQTFMDPPGAQQLPPYDLLYSLVDLYFKHVNSWLPLLNRKTTMDALFGPTPLEEADRILLHGMVATSLRFSQDPRLTPESKLHYHTYSKQRVQLYGLENSSVRALQALAILALDVNGTTNGPPGWNLIALISRSVVQLGLAAEATSNLTSPRYPSIATLRASVLPDSKSWIEDEERRRLFWTIYLLDRYATIATAFEFALDEKEIDRRLPCRDDLFAANKPVETRWFHSTERSRFSPMLTEVLGSFSYHCELLGILSRIHQFLKRPVNIGSMSDVEQWQGSYRTLDGELNTWHFNLPDDFANLTRLIKSTATAKSANYGWIILHAAYSTTTIRLNSSAAYPSARSPIFAPSYSAMQRCLAAVDNVRQLCYYVVSNNVLDKLGPPFAFALWVSARVVLVHGSTMDHEIDPDISLFVSTLSEMGRYWEVAQRYSDILSRVLEEYQQSQRSRNANGGRVTPSTVRILADMRRLVLVSAGVSLGQILTLIDVLTTWTSSSRVNHALQSHIIQPGRILLPLMSSGTWTCLIFSTFRGYLLFLISRETVQMIR